MKFIIKKNRQVLLLDDKKVYRCLKIYGRLLLPSVMLQAPTNESVKDAINDLIENKGATTFWFGGRSDVDELCRNIVTGLQKTIREL